MSVPTAPTAQSIVIEALIGSGHTNPKQFLINRAKDEWLEQIKHDIWKLSKKLKSLQTTSIMVTVENQGRYPYPEDYESELTVNLLHGIVRGTAQSGTSGSITLASGETVTGDSILGKKILIYENTAIGNLSQCTAYDSSTKVATMNPDWVTIPDSTSKYMIIDRNFPLRQSPVWDLDRENYPTRRGEPTHFCPIGDSDNGEFILYKVPHHTSDIPYGMQLRYYADLLRVDLTSTLMTTIYRRWRNELIQGVYVKALQDLDDTRYKTELKIYAGMLTILIARETYGMDLSNLQGVVTN